MPAIFIFDTEDGTIAGWDGGITAELIPTSSKDAVL
jgi:hypothetical protein